MFKHEDPSLNPTTHIKANTEAQTFVTPVLLQRMEGRHRRILGTSTRPASLEHIRKTKQKTRDPVSNKVKGKD